MTRVVLTDGSGNWFNDDAAVKFCENTRWDGRNQISVPKGSQWEHEALYYTKSGKWVLNCWSQKDGSLETYDQIDEGDAIRWLVLNKCFSDEQIQDLPESVRLAVEAGFASAEI